MRVTMRGEVTFEQLEAELRHLSLQLTACGVERLRGVNLYFTPLGKSGELEIYTGDGSPVEIISIHPQRSSITFLRKQGQYSSADPEEAVGQLAARAAPRD